VTGRPSDRKADRDRPLVSVALVSYNQEPYIRAAIRSAFAQTYSPLEVVLSDDCSQDRTFEIMQEEAQAYSGPHKVILNRNPQNLGVASNYNRAAALASGFLIVIQDGDDISLPDRTSKLVTASLEPTPVDMVCSKVFVIDKAGAALPDLAVPPVSPMNLEEAVATGFISAAGCACAYSRALWSKYGPINAEVLQEDIVLPFRALLERGIRIVDEPLVQYRVHGGNLFTGSLLANTRERRRRWARSWLAIAQDWHNAWRISGREDPVTERRLRQNIRQRQYDAECYSRSRAFALVVSLRGLAEGLSLRNSIGLFARHVLRLT
jgi:glycosyltransferase involved in cell wall biosynthesis